MLTHLLLIDVDGTLIKNQRAVRDEFLGAFEDVSGGKVDHHTFQFAGMTDRGIVRAMLDVLKRDAEFEELFPRFEARFTERLALVYDTHPDPMLLPGVIELLDALQKRPHVGLALGTGNCRSTCEIKLRRFGIGDRFRAGGFGGEHEVRSDALLAAVEEARVNLGWEAGHVWVIGDTVRDISAARAIGAKVLAVATGPDTMEELRASQPDALFRDLVHLDEVLAVLGV